MGKVALREVPRHVAETTESVAALHARALDGLTHHQHRIEWVTVAMGQPRTLYAIATAVASWIALNLALYATGHTPLDPPPFSGLQCATSVSALIVALMVLTTQNRQTRHAEQRATLDLQVNLLAEQKIAKAIALLEELRRDLPMVVDRVDAEADAMTHTVDPEEVIANLEQTIEASTP